jgi:hypothetical protein
LQTYSILVWCDCIEHIIFHFLHYFISHETCWNSISFVLHICFSFSVFQICFFCQTAISFAILLICGFKHSLTVFHRIFPELWSLILGSHHVRCNLLSWFIIDQIKNFHCSHNEWSPCFNYFFTKSTTFMCNWTISVYFSLSCHYITWLISWITSLRFCCNTRLLLCCNTRLLLCCNASINSPWLCCYFLAFAWRTTHYFIFGMLKCN